MNETETNSDNRSSRKKRAFIIAGCIVLTGLLAGFIYSRYARTHIKTDDAFVEGAIHLVAPRVPGTVMEVLVSNNQAVRAGDTLVRLEPQVYSQKLAEAQAGVRVETEKLEEFKAQVEVQRTRVAAAAASLERTLSAKAEFEAMVSAREAETAAREAVLAQASTDLARTKKLLDKNAVPRDRLENAQTRYDTAAASLKAAMEMANQARVVLDGHGSTTLQARANLDTEKAGLARAEQAVRTQAEQINKRKAQEEMARLNLTYTGITAPVDGNVTRKSVETGNQVRAGQPLMSVVSMDEAYVVANYKETKLRFIKPGQRVRMEIDAYPGREFEGKVDSIMLGTGSAFTLFPPENASGNYVKIVQRVPVKIAFENLDDSKDLLRIGMSVVPTILAD